MQRGYCRGIAVEEVVVEFVCFVCEHRDVIRNKLPKDVEVLLSFRAMSTSAVNSVRGGAL
jgi:hypothetical protein